MNINNLIILNNLLKENQQQLVTLGEILLILSAISSKKDVYLDMINELDTKYINNYLSIVEKYLYIESKEDNNRGKQTVDFNKHKTIKRMNVGDKEKTAYLKNIEMLEKEVENVSNKNEDITNSLLELELKYRDLMRENEILKLNSINTMQIGEEYYNDNITITNLTNDLMRKEMEIEDIKRENELVERRYNDEKERLKMRMENLEDKLADLKSVQFENEKLKLKIKELHIIKDKISDYDLIVNNLEAKNRQIENLIKEKQTVVQQCDKVIKESMSDKEKLKQCQFEKKKLEYEINDYKKDVSRCDFRKGDMRRNTICIAKEALNTTSGNTSGIQSVGMILGNIQNSILIDNNPFTEKQPSKNQEKEKEKDRIVELENICMNLEQELQEIKKAYFSQVDTNQNLLNEQSEMLKEIENLKFEIQNLDSIKDKLMIEKEKVEIGKQKCELDIQKNMLSIDKLENDKRKLFEEFTEIKEKIDNLNKDKANYMKELESGKMQIKMKSNQIDKILSEKQILVNDFQNLQILYDKQKNGSFLNTTTKQKQHPSPSPSPKGSATTIENEYKIELSKLKLSLVTKDEKIKMLQDRLKQTEKLEEMLKKNKKEDDREYYKKSYEEQKIRTNQEHELISNNLYDLALQFMSFKNELLKNVKPSILQNKKNN